MPRTILSTSRIVPTLALYYEPKGLEYFRSIGQVDRTFRLEDVSLRDGKERLRWQIHDLWSERNQVRKELRREIPRAKIAAAFNSKILSSICNGS